MATDPRHDIHVRVKLLDTSTGEERWADGQWGRFGTWWWTEGNGGCDCNRRLVFSHGDVGDGTPCTSIRYRVVAVEPLLDGYTLDDFNEGYP